MKNDAMLNRAKQLVVDYFNAHVDVTDGKKWDNQCIVD